MNLNLKKLPSNPGVYLFKDKSGKIIYVGKAINLKSRVGSYFQKNLQNEKSKILVSEIVDLETIQVQSEIESLLLEAKLIKKFQPQFNAQLKDDKDFLYILISKENFPAVITGRKQDLNRAKTYFGPFPSANAARITLKTLRRILPFRINCTPLQNRACLGYHIGLCPGVCAGKISPQDYAKIITRIKKFLNGDSQKLIFELEREVKKLSKELEFEKAALIQNKINSIKHITQKVESVEKYLSGPSILESQYQFQLEGLRNALGLNKIPERIECYDISNISGTSSTGSMVVLTAGQVTKSEYRRFKIIKVKGVNDPAMMKEVLERRFSNKWQKPDLIIVDGGKQQLSAGLDVLNKFNLQIPIFGLAKKLEEIYIPGKKTTIRFKPNSPALFLLQRIRDEAHRFAIGYHRLLRSKSFLQK